MQDRISATIDQELGYFARNFALEQKLNLSDVVELGIKLLQQKSIQQKMKMGYKANNQEASDWASQSLKITNFCNES